jgi:hypothetical protein
MGLNAFILFTGFGLLKHLCQRHAGTHNAADAVADSFARSAPRLLTAFMNTPGVITGARCMPMGSNLKKLLFCQELFDGDSQITFSRDDTNVPSVEYGYKFGALMGVLLSDFQLIAADDDFAIEEFSNARSEGVGGCSVSSAGSLLFQLCLQSGLGFAMAAFGIFEAALGAIALWHSHRKEAPRSPPDLSSVFQVLIYASIGHIDAYENDADLER